MSATVTDYELNLGALGTATFRVSDYPVVAMGVITDTTLNLPAGRWLLKSIVGSTPYEGSGKSVVTSLDTTIGSPGSVTLNQGDTYRAHKSMDNGQTALSCTFTVDKWNGSSWDRYAAAVLPPITTTAIGPTITGQRRAANVHMLQTNELASRIDLLLDAAKDMGFTTVRSSCPWGLMENAGKGSYDATILAQADALFAKCNAIGLDALLILGGATPTWATSSGTNTTYRFQGHSYVIKAGGVGPDNWQDYRDYVQFMIGRYQPQRLIAVEAPNEPNGSAWTVDDATIVAWNTNLYDAAKASAHPEVLAVCGTLAYCDYAFLQRMFDAGLGTKFDAISVHPYPLTWAVEGQVNAIWDPEHPLYQAAPWWHGITGVEAIADVMDANGASSKPIWITETGFTTHYGAQGVAPINKGPFLRYELRLLAKHPRIDSVFIHSMEDTGDGTTYNPQPHDSNGSYGFLYTDRVTKKPSYQVVKTALADLAAGLI